jgi:hypothetical protein
MSKGILRILFILLIPISFSGISSAITVENIIFPKEPDVYCYGPDDIIPTTIFLRSDVRAEVHISEHVWTYSVDKNITVMPGVSNPVKLELKVPKNPKTGVRLLSILITPVNPKGKPITIVKEDAICLSNRIS